MLTGVVMMALGYWRFVRNVKLIESAGPRQAGGIQTEIAVYVILVSLPFTSFRSSSGNRQQKAPEARMHQGLLFR